MSRMAFWRWCAPPIGIAVTAFLFGVWVTLASAILCLRLHWFSYWVWPQSMWLWWTLWSDVRYASYGDQLASAGWFALQIEGVTAFFLACSWYGAYRPGGRPMSPFGRGRQVVKGRSDNHGHASWKTEREALRDFPGPDLRYGGKVIGELPSSRLLIDDCRKLNGLSLEFSPSGGGKSTSAATRLSPRYFRGSMFVTDPKAELGPMLYEALEAADVRVVMLALDTKPKLQDGSLAPWARCIGQINPLDEIDVTDDMASLDVNDIIAPMFDGDKVKASDEHGNARFFRLSGRDLVKCLVEYVLWCDTVEYHRYRFADMVYDGGSLSFDALWEPKIVVPAPPKNLRSVREAISLGQEDLLSLLSGIKLSSRSPIARELASALVGTKAENQWAGIYKEADVATSWLTEPPLYKLVCGDSLRMSDIIKSRIAVFLQIPLPVLQTEPVAAKVVLGSFMKALIKADGDVPVGRVHLEIDEAREFGAMRVLSQLRGTGRAYALSMHMIWLSVADMDEVWGPNGTRSWYQNATWRAYSSVRDPTVMKEISELCGKYPVLAYNDGATSNTSASAGLGWGRGTRGRGKSSGVHEMGRNLLNPWEVGSDIASDEMIILGLDKPLLLRRPYHWTRRELNGIVKPSRFYKPAA